MLSLIAIGFLIIYSATGRGIEVSREIEKQLIWFFLGLILLIMMTLVDYEFWGRIYRLIYFMNILLLILVLFIGHDARGSQRWLPLGPFSFQPSELAKLLLIITLARFLSTREKLTALDIAFSLFHVAIPMLLILKQPDLGTALVLLAIYFAMMYHKGVSPFYLPGLTAIGAMIAPFVLKDYQKKRLLAFLNPESDPHGGGWNIIQSKIAIGSGKLFGKGLFAGTQGQLRFVPEHSTDFIFTVVGEELGLVGSLLILSLYFYVLWQGIKVISHAKDDFGSLIATGILTMLFFHVVVNIGMTIGIMPITGIPLPFISYGGSSLLCNMMAIGMLLGISLRREKIF